MKAIVIGSAEIKKFEYEIDENCIIICCDGGMELAFKEGLMPDIIVGDMDSVPKHILQFFEMKGIEIKKFPTKKNMTDMEIGIEYAIEKNVEEIAIFGGIGSRIDHTFANMQLLLKPLRKGIRASLINENNIIHLINKEITIKGRKNDIVSLIPFSESVKGIYTEGLEYKLENYEMQIGNSLGISNVMTAGKAKVVINSGLLYVIKTRD